MALPESAYRDPSLLCDSLRQAERKMQGCGKCEHDDRVFGIRVCRKGGRPDADGYCERWIEKRSANKKGAA